MTVGLVFVETYVTIGLVFVETCVTVGLVFVETYVTIGLVFVETCVTVGLVFVQTYVTVGLVFAVTCMAAGLGLYPQLAFVHYSSYKLDKTKLYCYLAFSSSQTWQMEKRPIRAVHVSALYQLVVFVGYSFTSTN